MNIFYRSYAVVEMTSILIHVVVYLKIYKYKTRRTVGPESHKDHIQTKFLSNLDSQSLIGIGLNLLIIITFLSTTFVATQLIKGKPKDIDKYPNYLFIYYTSLIAPGTIAILSVVLTFKRNKHLRKTIWEEVSVSLSNFFLKYFLSKGKNIYPEAYDNIFKFNCSTLNEKMVAHAQKIVITTPLLNP